MASILPNFKGLVNVKLEKIIVPTRLQDIVTFS